MKSFLNSLAATGPMLSVLLLQAVQPVYGHYGFPVLIMNNTATKWYEYVRPRAPDYRGYMLMPILDYFGETQVCGENATNTGHLTKTAKVEAGSQLGMRAFAYYAKADEEKVLNHQEYDGGLVHWGPGQIYMSKAPGDIESYTGDGEWFKIAKFGFDITGKREMNFTIPKTTPPGKYLVRAEHFQMTYNYNSTKQYIGCAQVEVMGPGGGTPGPFTRFPGAYALTDPGIWLPDNVDSVKNYRWPGPPVWQG